MERKKGKEKKGKKKERKNSDERTHPKCQYKCAMNVIS